jgi:hypothetical protein
MQILKLCLLKVPNKQTYTNYPSHSAADWDEQLIDCWLLCKDKWKEKIRLSSWHYNVDCILHGLSMCYSCGSTILKRDNWLHKMFRHVIKRNFQSRIREKMYTYMYVYIYIYKFLNYGCISVVYESPPANVQKLRNCGRHHKPFFKKKRAISLYGNYLFGTIL